MKTGVQMALGGFLLALPSPTFLNAAVLTSSVSAHLRGAPHTASPYAAGGGCRRRPFPAARFAGSRAPRLPFSVHSYKKAAAGKKTIPQVLTKRHVCGMIIMYCYAIKRKDNFYAPRKNFSLGS